jgi:membrane protein YfhO
VTEILSCAPLNDPGFELIGQPDGFYVYRNHRAMGRINPICEGSGKRLAFGVPGCADGVELETLSADDPRGLVTARASLPAQRVLVFSESYYPERRAWVDGVETPIEKVSVALSAIHLDPGSHRIELRLVPTSLYYGALISVMTLVAWLTVRRIWYRDLSQPQHIAV